MEAKKWIMQNKNKHCFASTHFLDKQEAIQFVKDLYQLGAISIKVSDIMEEPWRIQYDGGAYADMLAFLLPEDKDKIIDIMARVFQELPDEVDSGTNSAVLPAVWKPGKLIRLWWN